MTTSKSKQLSISDQLKVYKRALELLKSRSYKSGICVAITDAHHDCNINSSCEIEINPEQYSIFFKYHKIYDGFNNVYWFSLDLEGWNSRINLLKQIIKDCENELL